MKRFYLVRNENTGKIITDSAELAATLWERCRGLLGRSSLQIGGGMILNPCSSIHTLFMRFPIDVLFVDRRNRVVGLLHDMKPYRVSRWYRQSRWVLELPAGTLTKCRIDIGDLLSLAEQES